MTAERADIERACNSQYRPKNWSS